MPAPLPLAGLGRHLLRSVLRVSLPVQEMPALLPGADASMSDAALRRLAESTAAAGGEGAAAIQARLDVLLAPALSRFAPAADAAGLEALWRTALRGELPLEGAYWALLVHPQADRTLRHVAFGDVEMLRPADAAPASLGALLERRSISPRRLDAPGPGAEDIELMVQAALSAPDHGRLHPWRVIEFRTPQREALAALFEAEKRRRDPLASAADLRRARAHATEAPCLLGFVVSPRARKRVPLREQWLAAGAALGNLLNAAHQLGYGGIVLSGERCFDDALARQLGLQPGEHLAGFVSLGTAREPAPPTARALPQEVWRCWTPDTAAAPALRGPALPAARALDGEGLS